MTASREARLGGFIDGLVAELAPLERQYHEAYWRASLTGTAEDERSCARLDRAIRDIFARREPYAILRALAAEGPLGEPLLERQLQLLLHAHRQRQLPPETLGRMVESERALESLFNNHRAELDGTRVSDNRIAEILRDSHETGERRRAWEASKQIGTRIEADLLALVRLRNQAARELGFTNWYSMMLELDELDESELFDLLGALEEGTTPLWRAYKADLDARLATRFGCASGDLRPWHYADPFFQEAPAAGIDLDALYADADLERLTERFFAGLGFEVGDLLERADLYEKPGKSQHAFCLSVDRGPDIRVLCNLRPNERWMGTLLHEFGHAVYDKYIEPSLPWLLRGYSHLLTTEASAMLFGRLSRNPAWMRVHAGADPAALAERAEAVTRAVREQLLVAARWELVMIHMERALYRDPEQDLRGLWWDLVERLQGVPRPEGRNAPDWAAKIHFSVAPVYYHNYLLGELLASQLQAHLLRDVLGGGERAWERYVASPEVGAFLKERFYRPGRSLAWRDLVVRATGRPLAPDAFVAELSGKPLPA